MRAPAHRIPAHLNLVQVGLGGWGRDWTRLVRASEDFAGMAFVDSSPEALALAVKGGVPEERCFPSLQDALAATSADAVLITTGVGGHAPVALEALEAGLPVLVEKPFAATLAQAQEVVRVAGERGLPLMVSQNYRFHPAPLLAAQVVREERLGTPGFVEVDFRRDSARSRPPATAHHALPDPLLMDMAIHHFDLMRFVLGREPLRVSCTAFNPPWSPFRDPAAAAAEIEFGGGLVVSYRGSWASSGPITPWAGEWRMDAEGGEIRWTSRDDPTPDHVTLRPLGGSPERLTLPDVPHLDRAGALAEFAAAIRGGRESASSGRENLGSLALAFAARLSARERRPVDLSELLSSLEDPA